MFNDSAAQSRKQQLCSKSGPATKSSEAAKPQCCSRALGAGQVHDEVKSDGEDRIVPVAQRRGPLTGAPQLAGPGSPTDDLRQ
jgi:hypothetical protein